MEIHDNSCLRSFLRDCPTDGWRSTFFVLFPQFFIPFPGLSELGFRLTANATLSFETFLLVLGEVFGETPDARRQRWTFPNVSLSKKFPPSAGRGWLALPHPLVDSFVG